MGFLKHVTLWFVQKGNQARVLSVVSGCHGCLSIEIRQGRRSNSNPCSTHDVSMVTKQRSWEMWPGAEYSREVEDILLFLGRFRLFCMFRRAVNRVSYWLCMDLLAVLSSRFRRTGGSKLLLKKVDGQSCRNCDHTGGTSEARPKRSCQWPW